MALTTSERRAFTPEQLQQLDRFSEPRLTDVFLEPSDLEQGDVAEHRASTLANWVAMTPDQLRNRVNIESVLNGRTPVYSIDSDFTAAELKANERVFNRNEPVNIKNIKRLQEKDDQLSFEKGGLYIRENPVTQITNVIPGIFDKLTTFNSAKGVNGPSTKGISPSKTQNNITLRQPGVYEIAFSASFAATPNVVIRMMAFLDDVEQDQLILERKISGGGDIGHSAIVADILTTTKNQKVDIRVSSSGVSSTLLVKHARIFVKGFGI